MGQFFRVNGDYNIKVRDGGTITLNPGNTGDVIVVGNLTVGGIVTAVSSTELEIEDRIITVNKGETGPGVTLTYAGLEVDRGTYVDSTEVPRAAIVWNETNPPSHNVDDTLEEPTAGAGFWMFATGQEGSYGFRDSNVKLRRILTDSSTDSGDLTLIGTGTGVVKVKGTASYRLQVTDPDDIPNKDYVDYSILNNPTFQIRAPSNENTRVIIADKELNVVNAGSFVSGRKYVIHSVGSTNFTLIGSSYNLVGTLFEATGPGTGTGTASDATQGGSLAYYRDQTGEPIAQDGYPESGIGFVVDGAVSGTFYQNRVQLQDLQFIGSEIRHDNSNENIFINTNGTGKLQTNYGIQLDNNAVSPGMITGSHVIYSRPESTGKSGIFFVNTENTRDELVSKNRALLFSMLF
jgi:hypothetical protein